MPIFSNELWGEQDDKPLKTGREWISDAVYREMARRVARRLGSWYHAFAERE